MISLCYIRGIEYEDTPYFSNKAQQDVYFDNSIVVSIDNNSFYPPHYKNQLSIVSEDADFSTQFNYVILEFKDKRYYYIVDSVEYKSEDLMLVNITLDVIQTYMFNITFNESDIERRNINRWNDDGTINRNYLRENLSKGLKKNIDFKVEMGFLCLLIKTSEPLTNKGSITPLRATKIINENNEYKEVVDGGIYYIMPLSTKEYISFEKTQTSAPIKIENKDLTAVFNALYRDPKVVDISVINMTTNIFKDFYVGIDASGKKKLTIRNEGGTPGLPEKEIFNYEPYSGIVQPLLKIGEFIYSSRNSTYNFDFIINKSKKVIFSKKFLPQLIDENYYTLSYGERTLTTSYPLSKLDNIDVSLYHYLDITENVRIYKCDGGVDKYFTTVQNRNQENVSLFNDAWVQWYSRNKATMLGGILSSGVGGFTNYELMKIDPYDHRYSHRHILRAGARTAGLKALGFSTGMSLISQGINLGTGMINLAFTPDTMKNGNSCNSDALNNILDKITSIEEVVDIEDVAFQYEKYGFNVLEHYTNQNIMDVLNTRYYYNYIKTSDVNISLNLIEDKVTKALIEERFNSGIRFWNVYNDDFTNIGDYTYDNVEKKYLK